MSKFVRVKKLAIDEDGDFSEVANMFLNTNDISGIMVRDDVYYVRMISHPEELLMVKDFPIFELTGCLTGESE